eukprot:Platyproteum_vivax@DN2142_c0_g1_i1.p1
MVAILVDLKDSPSIEAGLTPECETALRVYGCDLIQRAGILLRVHQVTICSGQVIFHRFFYRQSLTKFDARRTAAACLFIATKIEEDPRRLHSVVQVMHHCEQRERKRLPPIPPLERGSSKYRHILGEIQKAERIILRELGFQIGIVLDHPHKFLMQFLAALQHLDIRRVAVRSWGYCNDSLRTTCCCHYLASTIAVAAIYLACCDLAVSLPLQPPWWSVFDVEWCDIEAICTQILDLYNAKDIRYQDVLEVKEDELKESESRVASDADEKEEEKKEKEKSKDRDRNRDKERERDRDRDRERRRHRHERSRSRDRYGRDRRNRDRDRRHRDRDRSRGRDKSRERKDRSKEKDKKDAGDRKDKETEEKKEKESAKNHIEEAPETEDVHMEDAEQEPPSS